MTTSHAVAFESTGPGGSLRWSQRRDGHWHADASGGHFDIVPMRHGYHTWWRGRGVSYVDLGHQDVLGEAFGAAQRYLDEGVPAAAEAPAAKAAEGACCGDEKCAHRHPPSVPTTACEDRKVDATSIERYNGGVKIKREYGSSTVTVFLVGFRDEDATKWEKIKGFGKTPGDRKTYAINEFLRMRGGTRAAEASLAEAPAPMHVQIPADAYAQWVAYGDSVGPVDTTEKIYKLLSPYAHKQDQEVFLVVVTDLHFKLRSVTEVARGERSAVGVGIEEVMRAALMTPGVAHMAVAHQHPTGKCRPSKADKDLHISIEKAASSYASLTYLDHVVIGVGEYHSIREGKTYKVK